MADEAGKRGTRRQVTGQAKRTGNRRHPMRRRGRASEHSKGTSAVKPARCRQSAATTPWPMGSATRQWHRGKNTATERAHWDWIAPAPLGESMRTWRNGAQTMSCDLSFISNARQKRDFSEASKICQRRPRRLFVCWSRIVPIKASSLARSDLAISLEPPHPTR